MQPAPVEFQTLSNATKASISYFGVPFSPIKVNNAKNCISNEKLVGLFIRYERESVSSIFFSVCIYLPIYILHRSKKVLC